MEFIAVPPRVTVSFRISLIHDLVSLIGIIKNVERFEGFSDWVREQAARIDAHGREILNPVHMLLIFSTGVQGYLVQRIPKNHPAATSYEALHEFLVNLNPMMLQQGVFRAMHEQFIGWEILDKHEPLPQTAMALAKLLLKGQHVREERWQSPPPPLPLGDFATLILDADELHQKLLHAIDYIWHTFYASQHPHDLLQQEAALNYHAMAGYNDDFAAIFRTVTGRQLPEKLRDHLPSIRHIEMIPSCHIGVYVSISPFADQLWIGFNANLVPAKTTPSRMPIAELYPVLRALADETRLKIVSLLASSGEQNVGDMADALGLTQSTASRHLSLLAKTQILHTRRDGVMRFYSLNNQTMHEVSDSLHKLVQTPEPISAEQA
jgi:ArsR family transcriptional regulator